VTVERARWIVERAARLERALVPRTLAATGVARLAADAAGARPSADESEIDLTADAAGTDPSAGPESDPAADDERAPWRRGRAGTAIGRAVHAVLQVVDLATGEGLSEVARAQAVTEGVPDRHHEIERLARVALDSAVVRGAVSDGSFWRELYVGVPVGDHVLEGFVDLLVDGPGGLTVVDYKTDAAPTDGDLDAAVERYRLQGAAYAVALERLLGRPVDRCVFLFLRSGDGVERQVDDLEAAKAQVIELFARL
jgi:ATP-dependent helicase/nuclease subunit A